MKTADIAKIIEKAMKLGAEIDIVFRSGSCEKRVTIQKIILKATGFIAHAYGDPKKLVAVFADIEYLRVPFNVIDQL